MPTATSTSFTARARRGWSLAAMALLTCLAVAAFAAPNASASVRDRNRDGLPDRWEIRFHLSLTVNQRTRDQDHDGVTNAVEFQLHLSPRSADSDRDRVADGAEDADSDGVSNAEEVLCHTNPADADTDNDGVGDAAEDPDADGLPTGSEQHLGTDPVDADSDNDGTDDGAEDADGDGYSNSDEVAGDDDPDSASDTPADDSAAADEQGSDEAGDEQDCPCASFGGYVVSFDGRYLTMLTYSGEIRRYSMWAQATIEWHDTATGAYSAAGAWVSAFTPGQQIADLDVNITTGQVVDADLATAG